MTIEYQIEKRHDDRGAAVFFITGNGADITARWTFGDTYLALVRLRDGIGSITGGHLVLDPNVIVTICGKSGPSGVTEGSAIKRGMRQLFVNDACSTADRA